MPHIQQYVSTELTHFVGGSLSNEEEQYKLLVNILNTGWLTHPPHNNSEKDSGGLTLSSHSQASANEMYSPEVICFCDIPIDDLGIHMNKYSCVGLSFSKSFLTQKGANPVFYIAKDSIVKIWPNMDKPEELHNISRSKLFDYMINNYQEIVRDLGIYFYNLHYKSPEVIGSQQMQDKIKVFQNQLFELERFLDFHVFSFTKFFDSSKADEDPDNFYMEREWRMIGNLHFELKDVCRVFLPKAFSKRFHEDVPKYIGELKFVEPL